MRNSKSNAARSALEGLFPETAKPLLKGTGAELIGRLGDDIAKEIVLSIFRGENLRSETEKLTRTRLAETNAALLAMFMTGSTNIPDFIHQLSRLSQEALAKGMRYGPEVTKPAEWFMGLTGKQIQNVLRDNRNGINEYAIWFDGILERVAGSCETEYGPLSMNVSLPNQSATLDWLAFLRLSTALGSQTLSIRGSEKSLYGKLFERLVLGSVLTCLGFVYWDRLSPKPQDAGLFWLSDPSGSREIDATLVLSPGKVAVFDIGFIGRGNSEISKDKVSRYERIRDVEKVASESVTFVIVDTLPARSATLLEAVERVDGVILEMNWSHWPRALAKKLGERFGFEHEAQALRDTELDAYFRNRMRDVSVSQFLRTVPVDTIEAASAD